MNRISDNSSSNQQFEINPYTDKQYSSSYYRIKEQRSKLPVYQFRDELINTISSNKITIVEGATGSGKTTQIPQFILEAGLVSSNKLILCTQPRRVAATSVARRVADELDVSIGDVVGYSVRFDNRVTNRTKLIYMTDGLLLKEFVTDPDIEKYGAVLIDEAHERNVNTDIIIGLLKQLSERREDLRVVIMSATLEIEKFQFFFGSNVPTLHVPGRQFNVEISYEEQAVGSYVDESVSKVCYIHQYEDPGGILLFLTGEEEINTACQRIKDKISSVIAKGFSMMKAEVLPLYAALPPAEQQKVFEPVKENVRKIVVSTNIAETSVTIDGIVYVVDSGYVKQNQYDPERHMSNLIVVPISQAAANQRSGRAGRTQNGKCYRLYTENTFLNSLKHQTVPEIQRSDIAQVILTMLATGIRDIVNFPFLDRPPKGQMISAVEDLYYLGAINMKGELTEDGHKISLIPLSPQLSKALITSGRYKCGYQMAMIVAILSEQGRVFYKPDKERRKADEKHIKYTSKSGDHITYLNVFEDYMKINRKNRDTYCHTNYLNKKFLDRTEKSFNQLLSLMKELEIPVNDLKYSSQKQRESTIIQALLSGLFRQIAMQEPYSTKFGFLFSPRSANIHPSSTLKDPSQWIMYSDYIFTRGDFLVNVSNIDPKWALDAAPDYFQPDSFDDSAMKRNLFPSDH